MKFSTFTKTSNNMPIGFFTIGFAINNYIIMGSRGFKPNCLNTPKVIKLMLAPMSHKALANLDVLMVQGIMKALESPFFYARDRYIITLNDVAHQIPHK